MSCVLATDAGDPIVTNADENIGINGFGTIDLINRKSPTGYNAFISQYIKNILNGTCPWKLPNGELL
jgi:hypothetical protein